MLDKLIALLILQSVVFFLGDLDGFIHFVEGQHGEHGGPLWIVALAKRLE